MSSEQQLLLQLRQPGTASETAVLLQRRIIERANPSNQMVVGVAG